MKHRLLGTAAALVFAIGLSVAANAVPISGNLSLNGQDTFTSSTVNFIGLSNVGVGTATGSYTPTFTPGCVSCVSTTDFTYNVVGPVTPFTVYSVTLALKTAAFEIDDITSFSNSGGFLNISATGVANLTGFDATPGTFLFSSQGTGTIQTTFSATTDVGGGGGGGGPLPEPASLAVLGMGLLGLGYAKRRKA